MNFTHYMLHNSPAAQRIEALWKEYEEGQSPEARFVKGMDFLKDNEWVDVRLNYYRSRRSGSI